MLLELKRIRTVGVKRRRRRVNNISMMCETSLKRAYMFQLTFLSQRQYKLTYIKIMNKNYPIVMNSSTLRI